MSCSSNIYCNIAILNQLPSMGASKTEHFSAQQNQIATIAKALGHPARVAIVEHLLKVNQCICNDIVDELPLAQPTISQHLRELKNAGIIQGTIEGNSICYCINENTLDLLKKYISAIVLKLSKNNC